MSVKLTLDQITKITTVNRSSIEDLSQKEQDLRRRREVKACRREAMRRAKRRAEEERRANPDTRRTKIYIMSGKNGIPYVKTYHIKKPYKDEEREVIELIRSLEHTPNYPGLMNDIKRLVEDWNLME